MLCTHRFISPLLGCLHAFRIVIELSTCILSRTRDKEKYRLRRQHKRNDIIAFRKMQQLRREFSKVTALVQLVLEREMLREVSPPFMPLTVLASGTSTTTTPTCIVGIVRLSLNCSGRYSTRRCLTCSRQNALPSPGRPPIATPLRTGT